jgi:SAM-dependent methyltransferase
MTDNPKCPICKGKNLYLFLKRDNEPVHQNAVLATEQSARGIPRGRLMITCCDDCGFIFNQDYDPSKLQYGTCYDNSQTWSPQFNEYHSGLVKMLVHTKNITNKTVVEVGCGKGQFIREIVEESNLKNQGYGFDPSYIGPEQCLDGRLVFKKEFYGPEHTGIRADAVICRHVIEHVPDPNLLLGTIRRTLAGSSTAKVFFETPCVEWILKNNVFWDFFYEHCSYFSRESILNAFEMNGFHVESVEHTFGGQYLWLEATPGPFKSAPANDICNVISRSRNFNEQYLVFQQKCLDLVQKIHTGGNLAIWGAGAKGVTLANIIDPQCKNIAAVIDINPKKQGNFIPGTGHPIIDYRKIPEYNIKHAILMNPVYRDEIDSLLQKSGIHVSLTELNFGDAP